MRGFLQRVALAIVAVAAVVGSASLAQAQITLPSTGVDVAGHVTALITDLGAVVLVAVGGYAAFLLIRMGLRWMRKSTS